MKTTIVSHSTEAEVVKEGNNLNRIVRATSLGWEYECDQRHVEVLVEEIGLGGAKPLSSPSVEGEKPVEVAESPCLGLKRPIISARSLLEVIILQLIGLTLSMRSSNCVATWVHRPRNH